jgi:hypothetical protein
MDRFQDGNARLTAGHRQQRGGQPLLLCAAAAAAVAGRRDGADGARHRGHLPDAAPAGLSPPPTPGFLVHLGCGMSSVGGGLP